MSHLREDTEIRKPKESIYDKYGDRLLNEIKDDLESVDKGIEKHEEALKTLKDKRQYLKRLLTGVHNTPPEQPEDNTIRQDEQVS